MRFLIVLRGVSGLIRIRKGALTYDDVVRLVNTRKSASGQTRAYEVLVSSIYAGVVASEGPRTFKEGQDDAEGSDEEREDLLCKRADVERDNCGCDADECCS